MAAGTGLGAATGQNVQADILAHLYPASGTVATAVTITGPIKFALIVGATDSTNTTVGTECTDTNYSRQSVTGWNTASTTAGNGSANGFTSKTSTNALTFGGSGFAAAQAIRGNAAYSSDATPVYVSYQNYASVVNVGINQVYTVAAGSCSVQVG